MYAYVKGQGNHLVIAQKSDRKKAEEFVESELRLYGICYDVNTAESGVLTNKEYEEQVLDRFSKEVGKDLTNSVSVRRLGDDLRHRIKEVQGIDKSREVDA